MLTDDWAVINHALLDECKDFMDHFNGPGKAVGQVC